MWQFLSSPTQHAVVWSESRAPACQNSAVECHYEKSQKTGHTDVILSFYIILHHILCCVYEQCSLSLWCRNCMSWTDFLCHTRGLENHLNATSLTSWESPGSGVEAVEIPRVHLQQKSRNLEICDSMFQLIPLYVWMAFHGTWDIFGKWEPSTRLKPQNTKRHVAQAR